MIKRCILFFILSLCVNSEKFEDIFNLDADEVITSEIGGDFYEMRKRLQSIPYDSNDTIATLPLTKQNGTKLELNTTTEAPHASTTERIPAATVPPEILAKYANTTLRNIKRQRYKMQLDRVLNTHMSVSDYLTDSDLGTLTRRFDELHEMHKENLAPDTRRETYEAGENRNIKWEIKTRYMNLISHFVYITRYKLVYPQILRNKYWSSPQYKLGFLFALVRHLKNMQKWLYWAISTSGAYVDGSVFFNLKIYEKIQRLDIDLKDAVLLITKIEYQRNIQYNPKFYDYSMEKYD